MPSRGTKYSFCRPDEGAALDGVPPVSLLDMFARCGCCVVERGKRVGKEEPREREEGCKKKEGAQESYN